MISKYYSIFCERCTNSERLYSSTVKECEAEAKRIGWGKVNGDWRCEECLKELKSKEEERE